MSEEDAVPCHPDQPCAKVCAACRRRPHARIAAHTWQAHADRYAREGIGDSAGECQWRAAMALQEWRGQP